ncbi:MAG TPA: S8 family serine peptidase [Bacteroidales bacterium]|nr:S8 family serine peptidase [Bacteroidales bacterium]HOH22357.1 S8 family serine peptidase [Bacteroidales bacterium]HPZ03020.1 S8 family serine peptidase [Bacteroidales bacterium]HQB75047.1 S8 family serine peptidase [Bacteroidales bacterium]
MKRVAFIFLSIFFLLPLFAQSPAKYWVQFKDKKGTPYTIEQPLRFLSQAALDRRAKYNIQITEQDLPVNPAYIEEVLKLDSNMLLMTRSKWLNGITIYSEVENIEELIRELSFVIDCERTIPMEEKEEIITDPFFFNNEENVAPQIDIPDDLDYGQGTEQIRINNTHWLHRLGFKGEGIKMMLLDGGFLNTDTIRHFELLRSQNRLRGARHYAQLGANPFGAGSHGTMVLATIASYLPGELVGSAPGVTVWLAQTEDGRSENKIEEDNWVVGAEWADSLGVQVINSSLGYSKFDDTTKTRTYAEMDGKHSRASIAASYLASKGIILCNSMGNDGNKPWKYLTSPAEAEDILAVGGVNIEGKRAPFSSYGPTSDGRIKPDAVAVGWNTYVANQRGITLRSNGTSFSSPIMAGMVACLWQAFPEKNAFEIMEAVRLSGDQVHAPDSSLGYGITDLLKAYNILLQKDISKINIDLETYAVSKNQVTLLIEVDKPTDIVVVSNLKSKPETKVSKKITLKPGKNKIEIKTPKLAKKNKYDFIDLMILEEEGNTLLSQFVVGYEKLQKNKK